MLSGPEVGGCFKQVARRGLSSWFRNCKIAVDVDCGIKSLWSTLLMLYIEWVNWVYHEQWGCLVLQFGGTNCEFDLPICRAPSQLRPIPSWRQRPGDSHVMRSSIGRILNEQKHLPSFHSKCPKSPNVAPAMPEISIANQKDALFCCVGLKRTLCRHCSALPVV